MLILQRMSKCYDCSALGAQIVCKLKRSSRNEQKCKSAFLDPLRPKPLYESFVHGCYRLLRRRARFVHISRKLASPTGREVDQRPEIVASLSFLDRVLDSFDCSMRTRDWEFGSRVLTSPSTQSVHKQPTANTESSLFTLFSMTPSSRELKESFLAAWPRATRKTRYPRTGIFDSSSFCLS